MDADLADAAGAPLPAGLTIDGRSFLAQLLGQRSTPRHSIYCWYQRDPGKTLYRFARSRQWKLYDAGDFERAGKLFDVQADPLEENPIEPDRAGRGATVARQQLQAVLDSMR